MVRTRAESVLIERRYQKDVLSEIHDKAEDLANSRQVNPLRSPRKQSASKQKRKAKRDSAKFQRLISSVKENLSKAADRSLPSPPVQPKSLFDEIHDSITSGDAKKKLKPVVIVIDD